MILAAAIRKAGCIYALPAPARHGDVLRTIPDEATKARTEQGFIDSDEGFVTRTRAHAIAREAGQIDEPDGEAALFSEDVWTATGRSPRPQVPASQILTLEPRTRVAAQLVFAAFGPGAQGTLTLAGAAALAAHWQHRVVETIDLWNDPQAWAYVSVQPRERRNILARLEPHCERLTSMRDGIIVRTSEGTTVRVRSRARGLHASAPATYAEGMTGLEIAHPSEALERLLRQVATQHAYTLDTELYDLAWAGKHDPDALATAWNCLDDSEQARAGRNIRASAECARKELATDPVAQPAERWDLQATAGYAQDAVRNAMTSANG